MADYLTEEKNHMQIIQRHIAEMEEIKLAALERTDLSLGYADGMPLFEIVRRQILDARALNLSAVPYGVVEAAASAIQEATRLFNAILNVIAPSNADITNRNITQVRDHWRNVLAPNLSNLHRHAWSDSSAQDLAKSLTEIEARLKASVQDAAHATSDAMEEKKKIASEYETFAEDAAKRVDRLEAAGKNLTDKLTATLAGLGAAEYMKRFEEEAKHHDDSSRWWLGLTVCFAVLILIAGLHFISIERQTIEEAVKHGVSAAIATVSTRILVMSILSVGLFVSLRNYSACRHNFIVNKHRLNALGTFKLFTGAADDETKKVVLLQAMKAVFDPQDTGYLKSAGEPQHGTQIIELIQSGLTKSGSAQH